MPNHDQTGPNGQGSMTGRGMGPCDDVPNTATMAPRGGRGIRGRKGSGMGRGMQFRQQNRGAGIAAMPMTSQEQLESWQIQAGELSGSLNTLQEQIHALEDKMRQEQPAQ